MMRSNGFHLAFRLALREMRGSIKGFYAFLACLALGVGAIAAVGLVGSSLDGSVRANARDFLGGDLEFRYTHVQMDREAMDYLQARGELSYAVRLRAMARSVEGESLSSLVEIKAVDNLYPLYGEVELASGQTLGQALTPMDNIPGVVVEEPVLTRLNAVVGDVISLGQARVRVADILVREPDKPTSFFALGPRVMMDHQTLESTGLNQPGSFVTHIYKLRLAQSIGAADFRREVEEKFTGRPWRIRDFETATPGVQRFLDRLAMYMTLVGLAALMVGGIGAAGGVRSFLHGKQETVAAMKCLGGSRFQVVSVYLIQTMLLAVAGCAIGLVLGIVAAYAGTMLLGPRLGFSIIFHLSGLPLLAAVAFGLLTCLAFTIWPLSAAGAVSPARLFRGYADTTSQPPTRKAVLVVILCVILLFALMVLYAEDPRVAMGFGLGSIGAIFLFRLAAAGLARLARWLPRPRNPRLRQALANLYRPGSTAGNVVFSLGFGLSVLMLVALVDGNLQSLISEQIPEDSPAFFYLDIPGPRLEEFTASVLSMDGVERMESQPSVRGRIMKLNGEDVDIEKIPHEARWAVRGDRGMTFSAEPPPGVRIVAGEWWPTGYKDDPLSGELPIICFDAELAKGFGLGLGDTMTVSILGREITARIACLREIDWTTMSLNHTIIFAPGTLDNAPVSYIATVYTEHPGEGPDPSLALDRMVTNGYPEIVAVPMAEVLEEVSGIVRQVGAAIRGAALVALAAGLLVLAEAMRATIRERYYDCVVFKVLGATRRDLTVSMAMEFLLLGGVTGLLAAGVGCLGSWAYVTFIMEQDWLFLPATVFGLVGGGMIAVLATSFFGVRTVLNRAAWPVLRNE